jgi:hypothetical protein
MHEASSAFGDLVSGQTQQSNSKKYIQVDESVYWCNISSADLMEIVAIPICGQDEFSGTERRNLIPLSCGSPI